MVAMTTALFDIVCSPYAVIASGFLVVAFAPLGFRSRNWISPGCLSAY
jgi:hypothetical protein